MATYRETPPPGCARVELRTGAGVIAGWARPGSGAPLLLIHGNSASKAAFRALIGAPALHERPLVAIDLPGCGESADAADPLNTYTLPGLATVVREAAQAAGVDDGVWLGWSLGGHVAIQAIEDGANPRGLVLTGTPPCGPDPAEIGAVFRPVPGGEVMSMAAPGAEQLGAYVATLYQPAPPNAEWVRAAVRADGRLRARIFEHIFANPQGPSQRATVARWDRPIALIQGEDEPFFDPRALDQLAFGQLWRGGTQWLPRAGHAPFISAAAAYATILAQFCREVADG